ncbi:hypothetical protein K0M31_014292 [Melipona bicolor]|uniref:Uncharacterized protein n=1 Tax=Melipona bicolor TaxID=60889 RepID=A0AA40G893_9HYME|nr:hypothetical protein K0M31_014292 [Melipona bicolor]
MPVNVRADCWHRSDSQANEQEMTSNPVRKVIIVASSHTIKDAIPCLPVLATREKKFQKRPGRVSSLPGEPIKGALYERYSVHTTGDSEERSSDKREQGEDAVRTA